MSNDIKVTPTIYRIILLYLGIAILIISIITTILFTPIYYYNMIGGIVIIGLSIVLIFFSRYGYVTGIIIPVLYWISIYFVWFPIGIGWIVIELLSWIVNTAIILVAIVSVIVFVKSLPILSARVEIKT